MGEEPYSKEVALLFSGGLDSTLAATVLKETYDKVHLLSVARGYGQLKVGRTRRRFDELSDLAGEDEYMYSLLRANSLFRRVVVRSLFRDIVKYKGLFVICVGCKLVMHTVGAIYCLSEGIPNIADGASGATEWMSDQAMAALDGYRNLHAALGLSYSNPVVEIRDREEERKRLRELGISTGRKVAGRDYGTQPICLYGDSLAFLREALFKVSLPVSDKAIRSYIEEKTPMLIEHVQRHFELQGEDISVERVLSS